MKKLIAITSLFIFIGSTVVIAGGHKGRGKEATIIYKTVNELIKEGYKLVSSSAFYAGINYILIKDDSLVSCIANQRDFEELYSTKFKPRVTCFKP